MTSLNITRSHCRETDSHSDGQEINRILRHSEGQWRVTVTCPNACIAAVYLEHLNGMTVSCCRHGRRIVPDVIQFCTVLK